jgi:hypothetical protein
MLAMARRDILVIVIEEQFVSTNYLTAIMLRIRTGGAQWKEY